MKKIENVNIIGMGALGLSFGKIIADHIGYDRVTFVMDKERYERSRDAEYRVNGERVNFRTALPENAFGADLIIVAVKYNDLPSALDTMETSVKENSTIISLMNGIDSEEIIAGRYGEERVIYSVAQGMDTMHFGTKVDYTKLGEIIIGVLRRDMNEVLKRVSDFFEEARVPFRTEKDIRHRMWAKFMLNVGANQTSMVFGTGYGGILRDGSEARMVMISAMREVILIARCERIVLTEDDLLSYLELLEDMDPNACPSMSQDRLNRKKSEVEMFAGVVMDLGEKWGIPVPANEFLYDRVMKIESSY
ncbi:MAG: 2-dehydropantoate 2-reductase [Lachnospiraceae bacterium]|nr:2-dehydropantoate 2-reductase [Lachnospiraceae bacterium]